MIDLVVQHLSKKYNIQIYYDYSDISKTHLFSMKKTIKGMNYYNSYKLTEFQMSEQINSFSNLISPQNNNFVVFDILKGFCKDFIDFVNKEIYVYKRILLTEKI